MPAPIAIPNARSSIAPVASAAGWRQAERESRTRPGGGDGVGGAGRRSEEHTSELQSLAYLVCRLLLEKKKHAARTAPAAAQRGPSPGHRQGRPRHAGPAAARRARPVGRRRRRGEGGGLGRAPPRILRV